MKEAALQPSLRVDCVNQNFGVETRKNPTKFHLILGEAIQRKIPNPLIAEVMHDSQPVNLEDLYDPDKKYVVELT